MAMLSESVTVHREDNAFRTFAIEQLIEQMATLMQFLLSGEGHFVRSASGVGEVQPGRIDRASDRQLQVWGSWWRHCRDR